MSNSLRTKLKKLRHDRKISQIDLDELSKKLDGHDEQLVKDSFKWLVQMGAIDCDCCKYPSECVNNGISCWEVMAKHFLARSED